MRTILLGVAIAAAIAQAEEETLNVTVCVEYRGVEFKTAHRARGVASAIFRETGVRLDWNMCHRKPESDVRIRFRYETPKDAAPGVIAYALPYEGKTVEIYYERVVQSARSYPGEFLGHVMAHEIAHVLQGVARHSEEGVLKARWSVDEQERMAFRPMSFTARDGDLIRRGIRARDVARAGLRESARTAAGTGK